MFDLNSRYSKLGHMTLTMKNGLSIPYISRRFLPQGERIPVLAQISTIAGDRIDNVASRTIGDPEQFWRICDANNAIYPLDLTSQPGRVLVIPAPWR